MQEIRASFFIECEELLEALHDGLEAMSDGAADGETINIVFRAVHSIKGGAGAFSLDQLVGFAHKFENALDAVRAGTLSVDDGLVRLFFKCGDILSDLVRASRDDEPLDTAITDPVIAELLEVTGDVGGDEEAAEEVDFAPTALSLDLDDIGGLAGADDAMADLALPDDLPPLDIAGEPDPDEAAEQETTYRIVFSPEPELYAGGNEPLFLFRLLQELGKVESSVEATATLPALDELQPNAALLTWTLTLVTNADVSAVEEVFEFVDGLCGLSIEPLSDDRPEHPGEESGLPAAETTTPIEAATATPSDPLPADPPGTSQPAPAGDAGEETEDPRPAAASGAKPVAKSATVRVDLERIDRLVNLVGELVINQAMLAQSVATAGLPSNSPVSSGLDEFQHLTRNIQESVMMIRAQPVKSLFQRMGRIVREASTATGKDARLVTDGEATEIDKTVIERLSDPLTHMIRNAVDHGLETGEQRVAAGKPERGTVRLSAAHRSGRVVIEVADDGGGINRARVQSIAEEKGLIAPGQSLADQEIDNLLFLPGFSTAAEVSNLSGRGVGMDVVKSSISALGGRISITSTPGRGTCFSISLPLTLAVLDGMVVGVEDETMVVPLNAIAETLTLSETDIRPLGPQTRVVLVRDAFVPLLDLGAELGYRAPRADYVGSIALLISQEDGSRAALVVDQIEDQRQVVIKGLQDSYGHVPGVAAATILGDGQIALILDPADLIANASGKSAPETALQKAG
ncbi:MAG: chemotaxis protein CheA [Paracoccaceae bacterium]|nr:chemotaxis protein CheA [Paracoccaceae bacterium]